MIARSFIPFVASLGVHAGAGVAIVACWGWSGGPPSAGLPVGGAEGVVIRLAPFEPSQVDPPPGEAGEVEGVAEGSTEPGSFASSLASLPSDGSSEAGPDPVLTEAEMESVPRVSLDDALAPRPEADVRIVPRVGETTFRSALMAANGAMSSACDRVGRAAERVDVTVARMIEAGTRHLARGAASSLKSAKGDAAGALSADRASPAARPAHLAEGVRTNQGEAGGAAAGVARGPSASSANRPPKYPEECRRAHQQGTVLVHAVIQADGAVSSVVVSRSSGVASLDQAALEAVAAWRFSPASVGGRAVQCDANLPVVFVLQEMPLN